VIGTCDPATRGGTFDAVTVTATAPNKSGVVTVDIRWTWDGTSVRPSCAGPVTRLLQTNTSNQNAWINLPNKATGNKWMLISPGANSTTTNTTQLATMLGTRNYSTVRGLSIVFTQPA